MFSKKCPKISLHHDHDLVASCRCVAVLNLTGDLRHRIGQEPLGLEGDLGNELTMIYKTASKTKVCIHVYM